MSSDDIVSVRLRYSDLDMFVERFAPNVTRGGIFLATRQPRPIGTFVRFEVTLSRGQVVLAGEGKVTWVREYDPSEPHKPHGMGVQFTRVDAETRPVLDRILKAKPVLARPGQQSQPGGSGRISGSFPALEPPRRPTGSQPVLERVGRTTSPVFTAEGAAISTASGSTGSVDLPSELTLDDQAYRRALDRARTLATEAGDLEELLRPEPPLEAVTAERAVADLPRLLQKPGEPVRRRTGTFRPVEPSSGNNGSDS